MADLNNSEEAQAGGNQVISTVEHEVGDIVSAVTTTYLGTRLWDVRITEVNENASAWVSPFANNYDDFKYTGESVAGTVHILNKSMVHANYTKQWHYADTAVITAASPSPDTTTKAEKNANNPS